MSVRWPLSAMAMSSVWDRVMPPTNSSASLANVSRAGLNVRGVATSCASEELARNAGIPIVPLAEGLPLALTVDGADEVDPSLNLIKGYGRALLREKIVAASSRELVILVGPGKEVAVFGDRGQTADRSGALRPALVQGAPQQARL